MNELKYVIVVPQGFNREMGARAIIFNGVMVHSMMVPKGVVAVSAGFMTLQCNKSGEIRAKCYGKSESLGLGVDLLDPLIIHRTLTRTHPQIGYIDESK